MASQYQYVLVTGATGFIGAHVVDELLRRGLKVRGTTRSAKKAEQMLRDRPQHRDRLDFVTISDLTHPGVFDSAVKGVDGVLHIASPVAFTAKDNEKEIILPAIQGVKAILEAAKTEQSVKRIVKTSSFAAVFDPTKGYRPGYTYTNADWNPITYEEAKTSDATTGYRASKKYAELTAWECIQKDHPQFDLVTLCPPMVFGPAVHPVSTVTELNLSNEFLWKVASGADPLPTPPVPYWVDVRDLAVAHVEALLRPAVSNRRFTVAAPERFSYQLVADILREEFDWAKTVVAKGNPGAKLPDSYIIDGETAARELGFQYRSFRECVLDAIKQFKAIEAKEKQS